MTHFAPRAAKVLILSAMTALLLVASAFAAEVATGVGSITGSAVRMRSEASTSSSIITSLDKDNVVAILDHSSADWYEVSYAGYTGYISSDYVALDTDGSFTSYGIVNSDGVNVRAGASTESTSAATLSKGTTVTVTGFADGWYAVTCQYGTKGYIRSDFVDLSAAASSSGSKIVNLAKQYLGTRYSYGGASPSGFDCSGFTMYIYKQFSVSLPHTATGQWQSGVGTKVWSVAALSAGDLVFFCDPSRSLGKACSHAGIYIGNGQFIHASSARSGGVVISSLYEDYYSRYFVGGIHAI